MNSGCRAQNKMSPGYRNTQVMLLPYGERTGFFTVTGFGNSSLAAQNSEEADLRHIPKTTDSDRPGDLV